uniref:Putative u1 snrnp component n=1 Tax=Corethrella appendiculata TaxID=1370023 RepID=U5EPI2_9DIPT
MSNYSSNSEDYTWDKIEKYQKENKIDPNTNVQQQTEISQNRKTLKKWLNNQFRIKMTDGRTLIGLFVCTDAAANIILGMTSEYTEGGGEERLLGLVMIPGRYIVSIEVDETHIKDDDDPEGERETTPTQEPIETNIV